MLATGKLSPDAIPGAAEWLGVVHVQPREKSWGVKGSPHQGHLHLHPHTLDNPKRGPLELHAPPLCLPAGKWVNRDCMLGMEFSGRDRSGRRVMGLVPAEGLATSVLLSPDFLWEVPSSW